MLRRDGRFDAAHASLQGNFETRPCRPWSAITTTDQRVVPVSDRNLAELVFEKGQQFVERIAGIPRGAVGLHEQIFEGHLPQRLIAQEDIVFRPLDIDLEKVDPVDALRTKRFSQDLGLHLS
jgi:hypothetical protein